jgi:tetratricopeptide (TPR) repeat protein
MSVTPARSSNAAIRGWLRLPLVTLLLMGMAFRAPAVMAVGAGCGAERNIRVHALDEMTWNQLSRIDQHVSERQYEAAQQALERLLDRADRDPYLQAIIYQALGHVAWAREEYGQATGDFVKAIDLDVLPDETHFALLYQLAQLYYLQERYSDSLATLERYLCHPAEVERGPDVWVLKASIHSWLEQYAEALAAIEHAIALEEQPREQWYQLKLAAHFELEQYPAAGATLEAMIELWPAERLYWIQLSQVSYKLKQSEKALAVMALAHRNGLLDRQADLVWLADLYSLADIPFKAATVMQRGIEDGVVEGTRAHWLTAADAWYRAGELELALRAYRRAGENSADGAVDLRRSYILVDMERWEDALAALDAALGKGGLDPRQTAQAHLLRGVANFNLDRFEQARSDWAAARRDDSSREAAEQWLNHLREERRRQAS